MGTIRRVGSSSTGAGTVTEAAPTNETTESQPQATPGRPATEQAEPHAPLSERDAGIRRAEHRIEGTVREAELRGPTTPTETPQLSNVIAQSREAGLNEVDTQRLQGALNQLPENERREDLEFLQAHVLRSPNADRALRTYTDARIQQQHYPDRITDDTVRTLTRSVAEPRSTSETGSEGIMSHSQAQRTLSALSQMPDEDYRRMQSVLTRAGTRDGNPIPGADPQLERGLILESLSARIDRIGEPSRPATLREMELGLPGRPTYMQQIEDYAGQIRGMGHDELIRNSTVMDVDRGRHGLQQTFTTSCGPTSAQITRAESDPIYALQVHRNPGLIEAQQMSDLERHGGVAVYRPGSGGEGITLPGVLNDRVSPYTGETYSDQSVPDTDEGRRQRLDQVETALERGADVPMRIQWRDGGGHFVVATDVREIEGHREFQITDPYTGRTSWFPEDQLVSGRTRFRGTGTGEMTDIYLNE